MLKSVFGAAALICCLSISMFIPAARAQPVEVNPSAIREGQLADLAIVKSDFLAEDRSYSKSARAKAEQLLEQLRDEAGRLTPAQFELRLAELAALADNGHTTVFLPTWAGRYNKVPVRFGVFSDGLYITAADAANKELVGARVLTIEGKRLDALRDQLHRYHAGAQGFRDEFLPLWIQSPELVHASGVGARPDELSMTLLRGGREEHVVLAAQSRGGDIDKSYSRPSQLIELSRDIPDAKKPLYLRDAGALFQLKQLNAGSYYLQFRSNRGDTIPPFAAHALDVLIATRPRFIILDERLNAGGDLSSTRDLMQALGPIAGSKGRLFILTSGRTFSAGIASVAYAKQAAGVRATIIGEPLGDRLNFWSEGSPIELPYSRVVIQPSPGHHNYTNGCPEPDCHKSIHEHPLFLSALKPDVRVGLTYADFIKGRDPLLATAKRLIAAERRKR